MNNDGLQRILSKHRKWINSEEGGECADLRYANLGGADLRYADLRYANLRYADLSNANLSNADLSDANLVTLHIGPYDVYVQPEHTRIGCQYHTSKQWLSFNPDDVACFAKDARELWETYGELVKSAIRIVQAEAEQRMKNKTPDAAALVEFEDQL